MAAQTPGPTSSAAGRYHGFELASVCWGYRELFADAIERLLAEGFLGSDRPVVTEKFFGLLKQAGRNCFDDVLKEFLGAMNSRTRWLMDLPGLFCDVVDLGGELARSKLHHGIRYFELLGNGGFGDSPRQVRNLLTHTRRLRETDEDLAVAFMKGYHRLIERLTPVELEQYARAGLQIFAGNRQKGLAFMETKLKTSETYIASITRECRLPDVAPMLGNLLVALVGYEVEVNELTRLDSDDLQYRGSSVVCMYKWLYVPNRIRHFEDAPSNRRWYLLIGVAAAAMLAEDSFCRIHGHPDYTTCRDVVGDDALRLNLFQIVEYARVMGRIKTRWPGAARLIDWGLKIQFERRPAANAADSLFHDVLAPGAGESEAAKAVAQLAASSANLFDTASALEGDWVYGLADAYPGLDRCDFRAPAFLPDLLFPGRLEAPPTDGLIASLKENAAGKRPEETDDGAKGNLRSGGEDAQTSREEAATGGIPAAYVYDEWCHHENDYYRDYCFVNEKFPEPSAPMNMPNDVYEDARRAGRVFEQFKPELARREKYLQTGDSIDPELLVEYLVERRKEPSPRVRFYQKPLVKRRDLAVLVLLDASRSTDEQIDRKTKVMDVEKHGALILGGGLASLGDRFAICGFNSNGRENCSYFIYKDFEDDWDRRSIGRILSAYPCDSTRIGPALRHSGYRMGQVGSRQRLIILITDGKPTDRDYDAKTRYAQYDIRMACEENLRQGIHTFGISTQENSATDMEIMFPGSRFAILPDIRRLPQILPALYLKLTA